MSVMLAAKGESKLGNLVASTPLVIINLGVSCEPQRLLLWSNSFAVLWSVAKDDLTVLSLTGYLMHEFHKFWIEEDPMDIMEFNRVREKFRKRIIKQLQNPDMALCPHFAASEGLINM